MELIYRIRHVKSFIPEDVGHRDELIVLVMKRGIAGKLTPINYYIDAATERVTRKRDPGPNDGPN